MDSVSDLTHEEIMEITKSSLYTLTRHDSLLKDLPPDITAEEVLAQIAVEHGQSINIIIYRDAMTPVNVIVPHNTTVIGLKKAFARHFQINQTRLKDNTKISWKYVWKSFDLVNDGVILGDNLAPISVYGCANKSNLYFKRKTRKK